MATKAVALEIPRATLAERALATGVGRC